MVVDVVAQVKHGRLLVKAPQAKLDITIPDVVACVVSTRQIVALGQTEEEVKAESPERWERDKGRIEFRPAFDASNFEPELAAAVLSYYAGKAQARIRPGLIVRFIGTFVDKFYYDFRLPGYEDLAAKTRSKFERLLRTLPCMRKCSINGKTVLGR